ncbi:guanylate kinase [Eubacterium xylanophilum]|uniref:guanylate kinase n=1 Tax=Eubacterium xylanophilum TaxID=39497 RepID=UPI00047E6131|nr:guanylate kinase [Eubacterium xylanophilum]
MKGILTVISGFSGSGKGTIIKELLSKYDYALSISATTRSPREGEIDGVHYHFLTQEDFENMIEKSELIEWAKYVDNYYGTPKAFVEKQLDEGKDVILEIEVQGGMLVKEKFPEALLIFVTPPSAEVLRERLVGRGTESEEVIDKRIAMAYTESDSMNNYDYIVVNDTLDEAVNNVHNIISMQHLRADKSGGIINNIQMQLEEMKRGIQNE